MLATTQGCTKAASNKLNRTMALKRRNNYTTLKHEERQITPNLADKAMAYARVLG
jgi:hypothetical protein